MKQIFFLLALMISFTHQAQISLDKKEFNALLNKQNIQLLDIRTQVEVNEGKIPKAVHVDYFSKDFIQQCKTTFNKKEPLLIYCAAGGRSSKAMKELSKVGFKKVYELKGGFDNWAP